MDADVEIGAPMCEEDPQLLLENDHFRCKCSDRNMQGNWTFGVREYARYSKTAAKTLFDLSQKCL